MAKIIFDLNGTIVKEILGKTETKERYVLFDGIYELITELKSQGHELFIWTMASKRLTHEILEVYKIDHYFTQLQTIDSGIYKPNPIGVRRLIGKEGYIIGDSAGDIDAGINAGITSIAALWGHSQNVNIGIQKDGVLSARHPLEILKLI